MSQKLISVMLPEEIYDEVTDFCYENNMTIKLFISKALTGLLTEMKKYDTSSKTPKRTK